MGLMKRIQKKLPFSNHTPPEAQKICKHYSVTTCVRTQYRIYR